jgi:hypothetical protein
MTPKFEEAMIKFLSVFTTTSCILYPNSNIFCDLMTFFFPSWTKHYKKHTYFELVDATFLVKDPP